MPHLALTSLIVASSGGSVASPLLVTPSLSADETFGEEMEVTGEALVGAWVDEVLVDEVLLVGAIEVLHDEVFELVDAAGCDVLFLGGRGMVASRVVIKELY